MFQILGFTLLIGAIVVIYYAFKYRNKYKLFMLFGKKGCGKTTNICKHSFKYLKKGKEVYCTEHIPGTRYISYSDVKDIGKYKYPENAVIFIDEVGMIWDNREFKSFNPEVRNWFKLQRHYKNTVYLYSQHFDIDLKLRNLVDGMYIGKSYMNCLSVFKSIRKDLKIVEASAEAESRIADELVVVPFFVPFSRDITWIPKYAKHFNSFAVPELPERDMPLEDFNKWQLKKWYHKRHFKVQLHWWIQKTKLGEMPLRELMADCKLHFESRKRQLIGQFNSHIVTCGKKLEQIKNKIRSLVVKAPEDYE